MSSIEVIIVLLLLFMAVPDLCRKLRRPALAYSVFVLFVTVPSILLLPRQPTGDPTLSASSPGEASGNAPK